MQSMTERDQGTKTKRPRMTFDAPDVTKERILQYAHENGTRVGEFLRQGVESIMNIEDLSNANLMVQIRDGQTGEIILDVPISLFKKVLTSNSGVLLNNPQPVKLPDHGKGEMTMPSALIWELIEDK